MFTVIARLLVQLNSSVNPIVYATTIPEFKTTIHKLFANHWRNPKNEEETSTKSTQLTKPKPSSS